MNIPRDCELLNLHQEFALIDLAKRSAQFPIAVEAGGRRVKSVRGGER
jgi:hypothetical protein